MRYLVCGDIHGNLPALELMLAKEKDNYDQLICHGDVVNYGPWSDDCVKLLNSIKYAVLLKGNHEHYFLSGLYNGKNEIAKAFFNFCYNRFTQFQLINNYDESVEIKNFKIQHTILDKYIFIDTKAQTLNGAAKVRVLDKGYVTTKEHKKLAKSFARYTTYSKGNEGVFHLKTI